ncbi:MAG: glutathione S-transferase N-terminal domain-containing protein [Parashewanella sp.]
MFIIRWVLGKFILILDFVFSPKKGQHAPEKQAKLDEVTAKLKLYQYAACPFCVKVRREIKRQGLNIELVDAKQTESQQELVNLGGKKKVPCLRIEKADQIEWLYESNDIINYLDDLVQSV